MFVPAMPCQFPTGHKCHVTTGFLTFVGLDSSVGIYMVSQKCIRSKSSWTQMALVGAFVGMYFHVSNKIRVTVRVEVALLALEHFFIGV